MLDKLDSVKEGATITVMNALAKIDSKLLKIDVDKWAFIKPYDQSVGGVNLENNISSIEYELVQSSRGGKSREPGHKHGKKGGRGKKDKHHNKEELKEEVKKEIKNDKEEEKHE